MKNQLISGRKLNVVLFAAFALLISTHIALAQDDTKTRTIDAEDFLKKRPADAAGTPAPKGNGDKGGAPNQPPKSPRVKYKFVRKEQNVARVKNKVIPKKPIPAKSANISEIGVTMWRLRPSRSGEMGPKIQVKSDNERREMWTPERVSTDTVFRAGDKVRFAIESSVAGYLYVVNSEIYSNGAFGAPFLIFPASANESNRVRPGLLVDFPDKSEQWSYFNIDPKRENYVGELLTVIVSPRPLMNLKTDAEGRIINIESLAELEGNADAESYAKEGGVGETYTNAEAQAVCDQKTRQLTREKPEPCDKTRQLTREEPLPQTIYRAKSYVGRPAVLFFKLNVNQ